MSDNAEQPIIVKKVIAGGHGHHGGSWKVAYADFVTAMMAFFMLLWLLNVTTDEQKAGIADYFSPASLSMSHSGANGVLGGQTVTVDGSKAADSGMPTVVVTIGPPAAEAPEEKADEEDIEQALAEREEQAFEEAKKALDQAIQDSPEIADLARNIIVDMTPEGMRIQLVDQEQQSLFESGASDMKEKTRALLHKVATVIEKLPNKILIAGHTDATPYRSLQNYSNWELSTDRANASRRALIEAGMGADRMAEVVGRADKDPFLAEDPFHPSNRRITIVLLREAPVLPPEKQGSRPTRTPADPTVD